MEEAEYQPNDDDLSDNVEDLRSRIEELESKLADISSEDEKEDLKPRVDGLESKLSTISENSSAGASGIYVFGSALAMILSWSRNASILWCIGHGFLSWFYVIYFAFTRQS